jgi:stage V sporulation protein S
MEIIKISARSVPRLAAGAIASEIREKSAVNVQAIGASAVNQAVKSIAIARTYLEEEKIDAVCRPSFATVEINGAEKTAIQFTVTIP